MKLIAIAAITAVITATALSQDVIPQDQMEKVVPRLIERASDQENLPLKLDADAANAFGMKAKDYGVVVIPNKGLSKEQVTKLGKDPLALGQLWMKDLSPAIDSKPAPASKLRIVKITMKEDQADLPLLLLAMQKKDDKTELLVLSKDKEPLLRLPLTRTDFKQEGPLELDMRKLSDDLGIVDINIFGMFNAPLTVGLLSK